MRPEIVILAPEHLPAAAELLAKRQAWLRTSVADLPESFTEADATRPVVEALLTAPEAFGVAALDGGRLVGYLIGAPRYEPIWDRAVWSPIDGQALAASVDRSVVADLYAAWAPHWVERGFFHHYVHAPAAATDVQEAWFDLNFGRMQAHAIRRLDEPLDAAPVEGLEVRRIGPDDAELIAPLYDLIAVHQVKPPAYAITLPERFAAYPADYAEVFAEPTEHYWAAIEGARALGLAGFYETSPEPMIPDGAWELGVAMTAPQARGRGVQRALLVAGFDAAREAGVTHCTTDWRTANLLSSRAWPKLGFRPTHHRLHRAIDPRVAWARRLA